MCTLSCYSQLQRDFFNLTEPIWLEVKHCDALLLVSYEHCMKMLFLNQARNTGSCKF